MCVQLPLPLLLPHRHLVPLHHRQLLQLVLLLSHLLLLQQQQIRQVHVLLLRMVMLLHDRLAPIARHACLQSTSPLEGRLQLVQPGAVLALPELPRAALRIELPQVHARGAQRLQPAADGAREVALGCAAVQPLDFAVVDQRGLHHRRVPATAVRVQPLGCRRDGTGVLSKPHLPRSLVPTALREMRDRHFRSAGSQLTPRKKDARSGSWRSIIWGFAS